MKFNKIFIVLISCLFPLQQLITKNSIVKTWEYSFVLNEYKYKGTRVDSLENILLYLNVLKKLDVINQNIFEKKQYLDFSYDYIEIEKILNNLNLKQTYFFFKYKKNFDIIVLQKIKLKIGLKYDFVYDIAIGDNNVAYYLLYHEFYGIIGYHYSPYTYSYVKVIYYKSKNILVGDYIYRSEW